ncbi:charged multivesicular body protein 2a-like [Hylaeus volcanicus]|uniref:charged multivesicular body protein 2a-like n=1 Tax=Hylaeus volcanicus TaxID=313075 RepID=UPI0023B7B650|nr:charged multivesicular body protein 2a-like [Hylaeus volcanicus]XP_053993380.1 charged multivesicular body protein 2a-like [Hylaeus volcanicus]XP_053993381.1 charged multivesicular body protein 2a-like [Hylaeus volcanicus]
MGQGFHKPSTEERLQNAKRLLQRAKRETEREKHALATEEEALKRELKKTVEREDLHLAKILSQDIARTRKSQCKLYEMNSHLHALQLQLQSIKSNRMLSASIEKITQTIIQLNKELNLESFQDFTQKFLDETHRLNFFDTKTKEMSATLAETTASHEETTIEAQDILKQVLDEVGLDKTAELRVSPQALMKPSSTYFEDPKKTCINLDVFECLPHDKDDIKQLSTPTEVCKESLEERIRKLNLY